MPKDTDITYHKFAIFTLHLFSMVAICNISIRNAVNKVNAYFQEHPDVDKRFKKILWYILVEWDNSLEEICSLANCLYKANSFRELEYLMSQLPELRDFLYE